MLCQLGLYPIPHEKLTFNVLVRQYNLKSKTTRFTPEVLERFS